MRSSSPLHRRCRKNKLGHPGRGFTLLEVLVTLAILLAILVTVLQFATAIDRAWKSAGTDPFADAANAFDSLALNLSQATLEPYQDYADKSGSFGSKAAAITPDHLARRSDLAFVCGLSAGPNGLLATSGRTTAGSSLFFIAPQGYTQTNADTGMEHLLNAVGYFVEFGDDDATPSFIPGFHRWRWRLKEIRQPSESLQIFNLSTSSAWIQQLVPPAAPIPIVADNVITLIVLPERAANDSGPSLAPGFHYDSRDTTNLLTLHQLPPRVFLALVAIDEASARILAAQHGSSPPALIPANLLQTATSAQVTADLASLDNSLISQKIGHRIFQREILLPSSAWSNSP